MTKNVCDMMEIISYQIRHVNHHDWLESSKKLEWEERSLTGWTSAISYAKQMLAWDHVVEVRLGGKQLWYESPK